MELSEDTVEHEVEHEVEHKLERTDRHLASYLYRIKTQSPLGEGINLLHPPPPILSNPNTLDLPWPRGLGLGLVWISEVTHFEVKRPWNSI